MRLPFPPVRGGHTAACLLGFAAAEVLAVLPGQVGWALNGGFAEEGAAARFRLLTVSPALLYHAGGGWEAARYEAVRMLVFTALLVWAARWAAPRIAPVGLSALAWPPVLLLSAAPANLLALAVTNLRPLLSGAAPPGRLLEQVAADARAFTGHATWLALWAGLAVVARELLSTTEAGEEPDLPGSGPGALLEWLRVRFASPFGLAAQLALCLALVAVCTATLVLLRDHVPAGPQTLCGPRAPCERGELEEAFHQAWSWRWEPWEGVPHALRERRAAEIAAALPTLLAVLVPLACLPSTFFGLRLLATARSRGLAAFVWGWGVYVHTCVLYAFGTEVVLLYHRYGEFSLALPVQALSPPAGLVHAAVWGWVVGLTAAGVVRLLWRTGKDGRGTVAGDDEGKGGEDGRKDGTDDRGETVGR
ncbi:hypothetical protein GCM10010420_24440 [Streptomyces glaucosporus]|uniref:Integral membrane protein n=1 Tax=Streptomyces glaucosporus TaxID=284044 RepID=A0ABN3I8D7_9ACTN